MLSGAIYDALEGVVGATAEGAQAAEDVNSPRCEYISLNSYFTICSFVNVNDDGTLPAGAPSSPAPEIPEAPANPINIADVLNQRGKWIRSPTMSTIPRDRMYDAQLFKGPGMCSHSHYVVTLITGQYSCVFELLSWWPGTLFPEFWFE